MKKNFNSICYHGGLGGHFLSTVISLDLSTYPLYPSYYKNEEDSLQIRKELYSFKNLIKYNYNWYEFHNDYKHFDIKEFIKSKYKTVNYIFHMFEEDFSHPLYKLCQFKHIQIFLDNKYYFIIKDFWNWQSKNFESKPSVLKNRELEKNNFSSTVENGLEYEKHYIEYKETHNPYIVRFENFLFGIDSFVNEYEKICNFIELPTYTDIAIDLYNDWYDARNLSKYKDILKCI